MLVPIDAQYRFFLRGEAADGRLRMGRGVRQLKVDEIIARLADEIAVAHHPQGIASLSIIGVLKKQSLDPVHNIQVLSHGQIEKNLVTKVTEPLSVTRAVPPFLAQGSSIWYDISHHHSKGNKETHHEHQTLPPRARF